jgi:hypothetical protein
MAFVPRVDRIDDDIAVIIQNDLSPKARSATLAAFAREQLAEAEAINGSVLGKVPSHRTTVDGSETDRLENVHPDGEIVFDFQIATDAVEWVGEQLLLHAPILTGQFRRSFILLADGAEVQIGGDIPQARTYTFVNTEPYARKIEGGLSNQAPDGVFQVVAELAAQKFGNAAQIRFSYISLETGSVHGWASETTMVRSDRPRMKAATRAEWLRRQPAITITV